MDSGTALLESEPATGAAAPETTTAADQATDASAAALPSGDATDTPAQPEAPAQEEAAIELDYPDDGVEEAEESPEQGSAGADAAEAAPAADAAPGSQRFGTAALTRILTENPELATAAEANPRVKAQLYQMARRSQELAGYQDLLPSLGQAKQAIEARSALDQYDKSFFGNDPEAFWRGLHEASGQTKAFERNVRFMQQTFLEGIAAQYGDEAKDAVATIREALGWGNSRATPNSPAQDGAQRQQIDDQQLPPHIRQQLQELEQLRSRRSEEERQQVEQFVGGAADEVGREIVSFVGGILANAGLSDYDKQNITRDFLEVVTQQSNEDKVLDAALQEALQQGMTPATRARMKALSMSWVRQNGRELLEPILKRAGASLRQRQQQKAQVAAAVRREPRSTGTPAAPAQITGRELVRQQEQKLGRRLNDREILDLA